VLAGESVTDHHPAWAWLQDPLPQAVGQHRRPLRTGMDVGEIADDVDSDALAVEIIAMLDKLQL
jgi:hypothetical protein